MLGGGSFDEKIFPGGWDLTNFKNLPQGCPGGANTWN